MWRPALQMTALMCVSALVLAAGCGDDDKTTEPLNEAPVIAELSAASPVVQAGGSCAFSCTASDLDEDELTYDWQCSAGTVAGDGGTATWTAPATGGACTITVTVRDPRGDSDTRSVTVEAVAGTLLIKTKDGLVATDFTGGSFLLNEVTSKVEVLGDRIYQKGNNSIYEVDHDGEFTNTIRISDPTVRGANFFMLPDAGFAFVTNGTDSVYVMDASGDLLHRTSLANPSEGSLQSVHGRVVGNRLLISNRYSLEGMDLATYEMSIYRDIGSAKGWIGALQHHDGTIYMAGCMLIRRFQETDEDETDLCSVEEGCWTGLTWAGGYLWGVINFEGKLCRIDPVSGEMVTVLADLDYPEDLEFLPVVLEAPAEP